MSLDYPGLKLRSVLLLYLAFIFSHTSGTFVGMNIGLEASNLPSADDIVAILLSQKVTHVRLPVADHKMLHALANTGIEVMIGISNEELLDIGKSRSRAAEWVNKNVALFLPATNISTIAVGNEVLINNPYLAVMLLPAMQLVHSALVASNINFQVKVSSPVSMDIIPRPFPPSTAMFNSTWNSTLYHLLQFLKNTGSMFMLNVHPYYAYKSANGFFPLDYALSQMVSPSKQIVDPNTLLPYSNMFEAMVDAAYYSMQALSFSTIPIVVTETGWPWFGGHNDPYATVSNARDYNNNLIVRILNGSGTPSRPDTPVSVYIYELFNEDRLGVESERNWGILFSNGTEIYSLINVDSFNHRINTSRIHGVFCLAKTGADKESLQSGLDWACGPGLANCTAIQEGKPCYNPNNLQNHASYAYNNYFHRTYVSWGTCNFDGTAILTSTDPSYDNCIFAGSNRSNASGNGTSGLSTGFTGPNNGILRKKFSYFMLMLLYLFKNLFQP